MDLRIFTEPQLGAGYDEQRRLARTAEAAGFDGYFRSDHYLTMGASDGLPGPTDSWVTLAGLARETERIRLGTLVTAATFRHPGPLAISVAQVDEMSGGRVELGLGTGWYEQEHAAYGIPFPELRERFEMLGEQLEIITGLWSTPVGKGFDHDGKHYRVQNSPALPKPAQDRVPIVIGGHGRRRTPALAARFGDEFNQAFPAGIDAAAAQFERVDAACREAERDPSEIVRSVALVACVGRDDAEVARRAAAISREPDELARNGLAGSPAQVVDAVGRWIEGTGVTRIYLQLLDIRDTEHAELIAAEVMSQL